VRTGSSGGRSDLATKCVRLSRTCRLARKAAREQAYVTGAIGPLDVRIEPWGKMGTDEAEAYFREQAEALVAGGVDLFVPQHLSFVAGR
jgi:methionine synthase I (cobalamin-dependent)